MTQRYLDPTNDVGFKRVFSDETRMMDFLNAVLRLADGKKIEVLEFVPTEQIPNLGQGKRSLFDLKCKDQAGTQFLVEMQCRRTPSLMNRIQYYAAHAYTAQLKAGKFHSQLLPIVVLTVMKEQLFPPHIETISYHKVREEKSQESFLEDLSYVFVELSKFNKQENELDTFEDEWLYFLKNTEDAQKAPSTLKDECVKGAYHVMEMANWTDLSYDAYVRASLLLWEEESAIEEAEAKGKADGKLEEKRAMAKALLREGVNLSIVAKASGLREEELKTLQLQG